MATQRPSLRSKIAPAVWRLHCCVGRRTEPLRRDARSSRRRMPEPSITAPDAPDSLGRLPGQSPKAILHMKEFKEWLRENHAISWVALIAFSLILFWLTADTPYHQFAIGLLAGSVTLLALMLLVEVIWWIGSRLFESPRADSNRDAAK